MGSHERISAGKKVLFGLIFIIKLYSLLSDEQKHVDLVRLKHLFRRFIKLSSNIVLS